MSKKIKKALFAVAVLLGVASPTFAADPTMSDLWTALGVDLGSIFTNVFSTIAGPIGIIISVVFVMTILYFVVWLGKGAIKKRIGFN